MRRWRSLKLRRGAFWRGAEFSPVPAAVPPRIIRPAGSLRTPARLLPSGRRTWGPPWFPPPPVAPPQFLRPAGSVRYGARLLPSRRRRWDPGWGQANQGQAWPSWTRQAGPLRFGARPVTSRGRRFEPPWFPPLPPPPPQFLRPAGALRTPARLLPSRRRRSDPAWPQGNQGQAWPSHVRQAGTRHRPPGRPPRGHFTAVPVIFTAPPAAQQGTAAAAVALAATVTISNAPAGTVTIVNDL